PHGMHYPVEADFLAAIEAMAVTIIKTVAAYNAEAAKQKLPAIEVLRNTLFSSAIYNPNGVSKDKIARAIFAGMASGLNVDTGGIVDLQFPVSDDKSQSSYPGFAAVRDDLANAKKARPAHRAPAIAPPRKPTRRRPPVAQFNADPAAGETGPDSKDEDAAEWGVPGIPGGAIDASKSLSYQGGKIDIASLKDQVSTATDKLFNA